MALRLRGDGGGPCREDVALGVARGGLIKQCILEDTNHATIWERDRTACFNVQILNSDMFQQVTGKSPPPTPVSAKTYHDRNLPFYEICRENPPLKGDFDDTKSVKQPDKITTEDGKWGHEGDGAPGLNEKATGSSVGADEDGADEDDADEDDADEDDVDEDDADEDSADEDSADEDDADEDSADEDDVEDSADDDADEDEQPLQNPIILLNPNDSAMDKFVPVSELMDAFPPLKIPL